MIIMGAVAAALALVLDGCKKEAAGIDLELNKESIDLKIGETFNLKVTNLHGNKIRWVSEDDEVATVDKNGVVTGIGHGRTIIAAWSNDGGNVAKCKVCVPLKINSLDAPVNYFPVWMGADNPIEYYCCPLKVSEQRDIHPQCCCNGIADDFSEGKPLS